VNWIIDADIRDFFSKLDQAWLMKFLEHRIADRRVLRLIRKWLAAGVIEDGSWSETPEGTPQGGSATPPTQWITGAQKGMVSHGDAVPDDHAFGPDEDFSDHAA
jgi:hypothetical protein